jgi:hypothetical protein
MCIEKKKNRSLSDTQSPYIKEILSFRRTHFEL